MPAIPAQPANARPHVVKTVVFILWTLVTERLCRKFPGRPGGIPLGPIFRIFLAVQNSQLRRDLAAAAFAQTQQVASCNRGCLNGNSFLDEDPNYVAGTHYSPQPGGGCRLDAARLCASYHAPVIQATFRLRDRWIMWTSREGAAGVG